MVIHNFIPKFTRIYDKIIGCDDKQDEDRSSLVKIHSVVMSCLSKEMESKSVRYTTDLSLKTVIKIHQECTLMISIARQIKGCLSLNKKSQCIRFERNFLQSIKNDYKELSSIGEMASESDFDFKIICCLAKTIPSIFVHNIKKFQINDEGLRFKLAKLNPHYCIDSFEQFDIKDENRRIKIARVILDVYPGALANYFEKLQIHNKTLHFEFAESLIGKASRELASNFHKFAINDEYKRIELAERIYKENPKYLAKNIDKFQISSERQRIKYARKCIKHVPESFVKNFDKFKILDENFHITCSELLIEKMPLKYADNFEYFNIKDEQKRIEYANIILKKCTYRFAANIHKFRISDEEMRFDYAKMVGEDFIRALAENFENFNIIDDKKKLVLCELFITKEAFWLASTIHIIFPENHFYHILYAKKIAKVDPEDLVWSFDNFCIDSEQLRFELLMTVYKKSKDSVAKNIHKFNISSEEKRLKLCKEIALENPEIVSRNIENFKFESEDNRFDIAKIILEKSADNLAKNFEKFFIKNEKRHQHLTLIMARKTPYSFLANIKHLLSCDEKHRYECAKIIVQRTPSEFAKYYTHFKLSRHRDIEFAIILSETNPRSLAQNFWKFYLDPCKKIELGLKLAKSSPDHVAYNIRHFSHDVNHRFQLAMIIAEKKPSTLIYQFKEFKVDKCQHYPIVKILIEEKPKRFLLYIKKFHIDKKYHNELANYLVEVAPKSFSYKFDYFDIDKEQHYKFAKKVLKISPKSLAWSFEKYKIENADQRFSLAVKIAEKEGCAIIKNIEKFDISNEVGRYQIAKIAAKGNEYAIEDNLKSFYINNKDYLYQIFMEITKECPNFVLSQIKKNLIADEERRFELIKRVSKKEPNKVLKSFSKLSIDNSNYRFEICKVLADNPYFVFEDHLEVFAFQNESMRYAIAKIIAENNLCWLARHFDQFHFKDPKIHDEFCLQFALHASWVFCDNIDAFILNNEERRFEFAKIVAKDNPRRLVKALNKFKLRIDRHYPLALIIAENNLEILISKLKKIVILNYLERFELAKIVAEKKPEDLIANFHDFRITNKNHIFELATVLSITAPVHLAKNISKFELFQEKRFEVAKLIIKTCPRSLGKKIEKFHFLQKYRVALAKILSKVKPGAFLKNFNKFDIDKEYLFDVIKTYAINAPYKLALYWGVVIPKLSKEEENDIRMILSLKIPEFYYFIYILLETTDCKSLKKYLRLFLRNPDIDENENIEEFCFKTDVLLEFAARLNYRVSNIDQDLAQVFEFIELKETEKCRSLVEQFPLEKLLSGIRSKIIKIPAKHVQLIMFNWLMLVVGLIREYNIDVNQLCLKTLNELFNLKHPELRLIATRTYLEVIVKNEKTRLAFHEYIKKLPSYKVCIEIFVFALNAEGLSNTTYLNPLRKKITRRFQTKQNRNIVLKSLISLIESSLPLKTKEQVMQAFISCKNYKDLLQELGSYHSLQLFRKEYLLMNEINQHGNVSLYQLLKTVSREVLELKEENINGFIEIMNHSRKPDAIANYLCCISSLQKDDLVLVREAMKKFITGIVNRSFKELRYDLKSSLHLQAVFKDRSELLHEWKKGYKCHLDGVDYREDKEDSSFNLRSFLKSQYYFNHLSSQEFPKLHKFLNEEKPTFEKPEDPKEKFQILMIQLFENKDGDQLDLINEIRNTLRKISCDSEFFNDLEMIKRHICGKDAIEKELIICDTDDPYDLFLCGTEVDGSCQRTNGTPYYNKALMGYVIDGKNRMIAIKRRDETILGRAIFRILLENKASTPVLFLERIYPKTLKSKYKNALINFAIERAKTFNLPLLIETKKGERSYGKDVESLAGMAPYEYSDSSTGMTEGSYTIKNPSVLYHPPLTGAGRRRKIPSICLLPFMRGEGVDGKGVNPGIDLIG